ncbi:peptide chain release factor N(5)-glutamine methyltransferase [Microvirga sp. W0021]|uniref:Release factor glutamine methyltransferase n=1 Tax=Hohaiivirga grylli TaxID=3133970 RepID=A0ABV0BLV5_9HYPH
MKPEKVSSTPHFPASVSRKDALAIFRQNLTAAGFETAALDSRLLLTRALGITPNELIINDHVAIPPDQIVTLELYLNRRLQGESVARITGFREFWGLPFQLGSDTLEPRPDTETLIEAVLDYYPDRQAPLRILDLGTGSGCILISLLTEYAKAKGTGVDLSASAIKTAKQNAAANAVDSRSQFLISDWFDKINGTYDLIVSNPPYIRTDVIPTLSSEVRNFDPDRALDGGADGLTAYRKIMEQARQYLAHEAYLGFEIGFDQKEALEKLASLHGYKFIECRNDLSNNPRIVVLKRHK